MSEQDAKGSTESASEELEPAPSDQSWLIMEDVRSGRLSEYKVTETDTPRED